MATKDKNSQPHESDLLMSEIAQAIETPPAGSVLLELRQRADAAAEASQAQAEQLRNDALAPGLSRDQLSDADVRARIAELDASRISKAADLVADLLERTHRTEQIEARQAVYEEAKALRDATALLILEKYPDILVRFLMLTDRILKTDEIVAKANRDLPEGAKPLDSSEAIARGFHDAEGVTTPSSLGAFRIVQATLPAYDPAEVAWPLVPGGHYGLGVLQRGRGFTYNEVLKAWRSRKKK